MKAHLKELNTQELSSAPTIIQLMHNSEYARVSAPQYIWNDIYKKHPEYFNVPTLPQQIITFPMLGGRESQRKYWEEKLRKEFIEYKNSKELTIVKISTDLKINRSTIRSWIDGTEPPRLPNLRKIIELIQMKKHA